MSPAHGSGSCPPSSSDSEYSSAFPERRREAALRERAPVLRAVQPHVAFFPQPFVGDPLQPRVTARERGAEHRLVALEEPRLRPSERGRKAAEHLRVLNPDQRPQQRRLRCRVLSSEALDLADRQAGDVRDAFWRVVAHARHERVESDRVLRHVFAIYEIVPDHHVHHREGESGVARGFDGQVPVCRLRGSRPDRIDDDDLRTALLRFADERPEVQVRDDRVRAPQHDEAAVY